MNVMVDGQCKQFLGSGVRMTMNMNLSVVKKVRRLSRKGKLLVEGEGDEKQEMVAALSVKTGKTDEESVNHPPDGKVIC